MCFNQKYSASFALLGLFSLYFFNKNKKYYENNLLYIPLIFYTLMEVLQTAQYNYVNQCDNIMNKLLTEISYILVVVQPFMWNMIFLYRQRKIKLTDFHKGILYCGIILSLIWIIAHIFRRFSFYGNDEYVNEVTQGKETCTYKKDNEHLYWKYKYNSVYGMDANWFMYLVLWFIPGLLIPGEFLTILTLVLGFALSYMYIIYNSHTRDITPSLWCLTSGPTLFLNIIIYYFYGK